MAVVNWHNEDIHYAFQETDQVLEWDLRLATNTQVVYSNFCSGEYAGHDIHTPLYILKEARPCGTTRGRRRSSVRVS